MVLYYQVTYALTDIAADEGYFHAQFRRTNPVPYKQVYTIVDGLKGEGHYVGTHLSWGVHNSGWWGEGEIKFYMDGDTDFATIVGTGTEDYFCGSYNFENPVTHKYQVFSTPYSGLTYVSGPDGVYQSQQRFNLYRWHITDPIRFEKDLRVTIQALGLAQQRALPAAAGRHRVGGLLVSGRAARAVPGAAGPRRARDPVSWPTRSGSRVAIVCLLVAVVRLARAAAARHRGHRHLEDLDVRRVVGGDVRLRRRRRSADPRRPRVAGPQDHRRLPARRALRARRGGTRVSLVRPGLWRRRPADHRHQAARARLRHRPDRAVVVGGAPAFGLDRRRALGGTRLLGQPGDDPERRSPRLPRSADDAAGDRDAGAAARSGGRRSPAPRFADRPADEAAGNPAGADPGARRVASRRVSRCRTRRDGRCASQPPWSCSPSPLVGALPNMWLAFGSFYARRDILSGNAANLWWIVTYVLRAWYQIPRMGVLGAYLAPVRRILAITTLEEIGLPNPRPFGTVLVLGASAWGLWRIRHARDLALHALGAAFVVHAFFVLGVGVHEHHMMLAVPLLALAAALRPGLRPLFYAVSAIVALNMNVFYGLGYGFGWRIPRGLLLSISACCSRPPTSPHWCGTDASWRARRRV